MEAEGPSPTAIAAALEPLFTVLAFSLTALENTLSQVPGSAVVVRYVKSSHQNDPGRTILELLLFVFAVRTLLQSRTRAEKGTKHFIQFTEKVSSCFEANTNESYSFCAGT